jgi:hypothetical protein
MLLHFRRRISAWSSRVQIYHVQIKPFGFTLVQRLIASSSMAPALRKHTHLFEFC